MRICVCTYANIDASLYIILSRATFHLAMEVLTWLMNPSSAFPSHSVTSLRWHEVDILGADSFGPGVLSGHLITSSRLILTLYAMGGSLFFRWGTCSYEVVQFAQGHRANKGEIWDSNCYQIQVHVPDTREAQQYQKRWCSEPKKIYCGAIQGDRKLMPPTLQIPNS